MFSEAMGTQGGVAESAGGSLYGGRQRAHLLSPYIHLVQVLLERRGGEALQ